MKEKNLGVLEYFHNHYKQLNIQELKEVTLLQKLQLNAKLKVGLLYHQELTAPILKIS